MRSVLALLLLVGCSSQPASPMMDSGAAPDTASPMDEGGASTKVLSWTTSTTKSRLRNHHMTVYAETAGGNFLYAIGGAQSKSTVIGNVDRMPIAADGSVGAPMDDLALPVPLAGLTGGLVSNVIVIAGGMTATGASDKSWSTVIKPDGSLDAWKAGGSVGEGRFHGGAITSGNSVWVMGGFSSVVWDDIVRATVASDGTLSAWMPAGKLVGPRSHFSASLVEGYVYVAGGLDQTETNGPVPSLTEVSRGKLAEDGTIGDWQIMTPLPGGMATHASVQWGGWLYVVGGLTTNLKVEKRVWRAPIDHDHALGDWEEAAPLPIARAHVHQLPVVGNKVYSVSGAIDLSLNSTDAIHVGLFQ